MKKLMILVIVVGFVGCASQPTKRSVQNSKSSNVAVENTSAPGLVEVQALHGSSRAGGSLGGTMSRR